MTPEEAQWRVGVIRITAYDNEVAHSLEDDLYYDIVKLIASIEDNSEFTFFDLSELVQVAKIALQTRGIEFSRQCA